VKINIRNNPINTVTRNRQYNKDRQWELIPAAPGAALPTGAFKTIRTRFSATKELLQIIIWSFDKIFVSLRQKFVIRIIEE
jgi:hypothetical protein